ncbi:hypothetical protein HNR60_002486 [Rhodopseudomonas rhenobacensis]|uniref:Uncharacterized protein n=1 Tax=Rhodopseudomonas rhenobacensis TaxID=87461 RepID=A0A7W7Z4D1_9BRAD|nr:hypothetical protein [Rhodopseudomonas rhenobacensis]
MLMTRAVVCGALLLTAGSALAQKSSFDGVWNVTVVTKAGSCEPKLSYPVVVTDGRVTGSPDITGIVGREGNVKVSIRGAYANGQLNGSAGSGKWNSAAAGVPCSGRWEATRG